MNDTTTRWTLAGAILFFLCAGALFAWGYRTDAPLRDPEYLAALRDLAAIQSPPAQSKRIKSPMIRALVERDGVEAITVMNFDTYDWPGGKMFLNGILGGYRYHFAPIKAGSTVRIPLILFEKRNGNRFQPLLTAPHELIIQVDGHSEGGCPIYNL